jgi:hypothetical protein
MLLLGSDVSYRWIRTLLLGERMLLWHRDALL